MANETKVFGYHKENDCENDYYPENLHLVWEDDTYGLYFVRADNNKILEKSTDKMATTSTVETRTNKNIARGFHDKVNHIIYLVDCDYNYTQSFIWSIDLSDDSITEVEQVNGMVYDIWRYGSETYLLFFGDYAAESQVIRPTGDGANKSGASSWTPVGEATRFEAIDEAAADDGDYIIESTLNEWAWLTFPTIDLSGYDSGEIYKIVCRIRHIRGGDSNPKITISGNAVGMDAEEFSSLIVYVNQDIEWSGLSLNQADLDDLEIKVEHTYYNGKSAKVSQMYCTIYWYGDLSGNLKIRNIDADTDWTNAMGAIAGRENDISQITIVGTDFHFNWKWSNENVEHWRFQTGDNSFDELEDCGSTTELPQIQQHGISYDDSDVLYFVLGTGTAEVSTIIAEVPANIDDGDYITYSAIEKNAVTGEYSEKDYYIWFDKAGDESGDPAPADKTEILVDISASVTDQDVSDAIESAVNAITLITCDNAAGLTCTLTCHYNGNTTNIADVDAGLVVATTVPGVANVYYLYTYGITDDALTKTGLYPIALMLNRNTDVNGVPECMRLEKAFNLDEMKVHQISRAKGNLNLIANWLTSLNPTDFPNTKIVSITDSYVFIDKTGDSGNMELWEYINVISTLIVESIINTQERMRPSCNIKYLKKEDYNDPPIEGQMYTVYGRYSSANL